ISKDIQEQLEDLKRRITILEQAISKTRFDTLPEHRQSKKLSIKEFLISKKTTNNVQKTLAIGCFLEKNEGFISFNVDDLRSEYEKAKEKKPLNINDKVNINVKNGHMAEASEKKDNKKAWYITNSGERLLENNFDE